MPGSSFREASARMRIAGLLDAGSFVEFLGPAQRACSPHLQALDLPAAFDDGVMVGRGRIAGQGLLLAAQEGSFMGGSVGEVHGAKITGLLERAQHEKPAAVLLLVESGGVRLHEANAGLIAVSEIMRAVLSTRTAGVPVLVLNGGQYGCFGGMSIVSRLCDAIIMSEEGRMGLSGPEVIESTCGVEEFDSRDRALVWRTVGGKHRYLTGDAAMLVEDDIAAFRAAVLRLIASIKKPDLSLDALVAEHQRLGERLARFGGCSDALDIWRLLGAEAPESLPLMEIAEFLSLAGSRGRS
ncbi:MAG: biotin-independent malonate decarboxylase subunit beta [Steroidobacteraceae bacterium]